MLAHFYLLFTIIFAVQSSLNETGASTLQKAQCVDSGDDNTSPSDGKNNIAQQIQYVILLWKFPKKK